MIGFLVRRLIQAVFVVIGVILIMFTLVHVIPGGEARTVLGPRAAPFQIAQFNKLNGLNLPLWDQFVRYIWDLARFQLGTSPKYNQSVSALIDNRLPKTLVLVGFATLLASIVAIPLGIYQVVRRYKPEDYVITALAFVFYAMPAFLLGTLLILWFSIYLPWLSVEGPQGVTIGSDLTDPRAFVLPVLTLSALTIASFSRYMRSSMMETMTEDFIRTARAKGASPNRVLYVHALRNAIIPIVTLLGLSIGTIVSGAVITESVFNFPGMGLLAITSAFNEDIPTLLGVTFVITVATVAGNFLADVLYAVVDPGSVMQEPDDLPDPLEPIKPSPLGEAEFDGELPSPPAGGEVGSHGGMAVRILRVFVENKLAVVGLFVIVAMLVFCYVGPFLYHSNQTNAEEALIYSTENAPPGTGHPLGTDANGFDILGRLMYGGQISLLVGFTAAAIASVFGALYGAIAGFFGGWIDVLMMRIVDAFLSIPVLFLGIVLAVIFRPSLEVFIFVIAFVSWLIPACLVRGQSLTLRVREYVQAVRVMGGRRGRIIMRHIIPNTIGTIIVNATFNIADAILLLAALGFIGLGVPPPQTDWGSMLSNGVNLALDGYWWEIYPAGICIVLVVVAFNFIGDALRDALEVRLQHR